EAAPAGTRLAWAHTAGGEYPVFVGRGVLALAAPGLAGRGFVVTDSEVAEHHLAALRDPAGVVEIPPGEESKTLQTAERVWRALAAQGVTRADHLVALGGGVVGDLAGFCAACYQRGIPVVQAPTTVVSQVDSAYGGKTGVDLPEAKNYVGAYHLPAGVITDPGTLRTLPPGELAAGFAEVLKTGLIAGGELWERVRSLESLDPDALDEIVFACARTKLGVVAADERDSGRRGALNLGHTVGHAIEAATGYDVYRHGEAIGLGLLAALELSGAAELRDEVEASLERHGLPTRLGSEAGVDEIVEATGRDKKRTSEGLGFVLCPRPGEVLTDQRVEPSALRAAVERLR
ncbi:MAG: 3-dehydroquinate synthase family protein, partial [Solirubrobacterales bacterium]